MTPELKEEMIRMLEEDKTDEEIINALGISRRCFYNHLDMGKYGRYYQMTPELNKEMIRMLEEGKTDEEIIAALGISRRCFYNHVGK